MQSPGKTCFIVDDTGTDESRTMMQRLFVNGRHNHITPILCKQRVLLNPGYIHCVKCDGTCVRPNATLCDVCHGTGMVCEPVKSTGGLELQ